MTVSEKLIVIDEAFDQHSLTGHRFEQWVRSRSAAFARSGMSYQSASTMTHAPRRAKLSEAVRSIAGPTA